MQRVAKELGYTTMSLYNYVPSKDQLVELMIDAATPPPPFPSKVRAGATRSNAGSAPRGTSTTRIRGS